MLLLLLFIYVYINEPVYSIKSMCKLSGDNSHVLFILYTGYIYNVCICK